MILQRIKSEGLAHNSYFLASGNEAIVIDPRRDCQVYLDLAEKYGNVIMHVFETHCNEDYLSGSIELENLTGADIYHGPGLEWKFGNTLADGEEFRLGKIRIRALHTPGHTDESTSFIVYDSVSGSQPVMVFTGDTLFVNEVGRTDLCGPGEAQRLAANLFESIFGRLLPLGDGVIVLPAHGAGSVCGASIGDREETSLGIERLLNPALQARNKEDFIKRKIAERMEKPPYFDNMARDNREGPPLLGYMPVPVPLMPNDFRYEVQKAETVLVDASAPAAFGGAHIKGSYNLALPILPIYAGWVLPYDAPLLLVLQDPSHLDQVARHLLRVGYDNITGYLKGGVESWYNTGLPVEHLPVLTVQELRVLIESRSPMTVLDVRTQAEWEQGRIEGAMHKFVGHLKEGVEDIPARIPVATTCSVGNRASLAASILLQENSRDVYNVLGSMKAWTAAGYPVVKDPVAVSR